MAKSKDEYTVTVYDYNHMRHSSHKTIAVSVKQAINNVAHRLGVHFCLDRPYYTDAHSSIGVTVVECSDKVVMFL